MTGRTSRLQQSAIHPSYFSIASGNQTVWMQVAIQSMFDHQTQTTGGMLNPLLLTSTNSTTGPVYYNPTPLASPPAAEPAFNKYLSASDLMEEFVKFCKLDRISKKEFLDLPIKLFMMWVVLEAAKEDDMEPPADLVANLDRELKLLVPPESDPQIVEGDGNEQKQLGQENGDQPQLPPAPEVANELLDKDQPELTYESPHNHQN